VKKRKGFVSNSSSSSFIIGVKGELTEEKLMKAFKVNKDSPLYSLVTKMAQVMKKKSDVYTKEEYLDDMCCGEEDLSDTVVAIIERGFKIYRGWVSDEEGDPAESALYNLALNYTDEDLILFAED